MKQLTAAKASKIVKEGARMLDSRYKLWHKRVDLGFLELESCTTCVLGHVFGDFGNAPSKFMQHAAFCGNIHPSGYKIKLMTTAWKHEIKRRQAR